MKLILNFNNFAIACACAALVGCRPATPPDATDHSRDLLRLVSVLDYVSTDYPLAVQKGRVVIQAEYDEQISFLRSASALLGTIGPAQDARADREIDARLAALRAVVDRRGEATEVAARSRDLRRRIVDAYGLVLSPAVPPSEARGKRLYEANCATCHGRTGRPPAEKVRLLRPPPANLTDPALLRDLAPYRVFNSVTFGVQGTAMAAFDSLSERERWDLSFHVLAMAHAGESASPEAVPDDVLRSIHLLATSSDRALGRRLEASGLESRRVPAAIAHLRTRAPFDAAAGRAPLATARRLVGEAVDAYAAGLEDRARSLALDAYLEGFEPVEPALRVRDAAGVRRTEEAFVALRQAIDSHGTAGRVAAAGRTVLAALARAEETTAERGSASMAFGASLLIIVREGIEAALIVAALLGLLSKLGRDRSRRDVHAGWITALVAGAVTWIAGRGLLLRAGRAEWLEGALTLAAAVVLFWASYWLLSRAEAKKWMSYLKERVEQGAIRGGRLGVFGIAFLAVYREAFETALFYEALARGGFETALLGGAAVGAVLLVGIIAILLRSAKRLPIQAFFTASGAILYALCVVFVGHGVHELQGAGALPIRPVGHFRLEAVGVYPDLISLVPQAALVLVYLGSVALKARAGLRHEPAKG